MTKILLVEEFKTTGGEEEVVYNLFSGLAACSDFEVYIAAPKNAAYYKKHSFPEDRHLILPMKSKHDVESIRLLRGFVREQGIDIVHSHGDRAGLIARIACKGLPVQSVWTMHAYSGDNRITQGGAKRKLKLFVQKLLNRYFTDRVICVSENLQKIISPYMESGSTTVIYNGIDLSRFNAVLHKAECRTELRGLFAGRLSEQKGLPYLLEGIELARSRGVKVRVDIAGEGPMLTYVEAYIAEHGLMDSVQLLGFRSDIDELLKESDFLLLPSLFEGFPVIILEALASGTPVIASAVNGVPEIVRDKTNGLLIEPSSSQSLCDAIEYVWRNREWLCGASREAIRSAEDFSIERMVDAHKFLYEELIAKGR